MSDILDRLTAENLTTIYAKDASIKEVPQALADLVQKGKYTRITDIPAVTIPVQSGQSTPQVILIHEDSKIVFEPDDLPFPVIKIVWSGSIPPCVSLPPPVPCPPRKDQVTTTNLNLPFTESIVGLPLLCRKCRLVHLVTKEEVEQRKVKGPMSVSALLPRTVDPVHLVGFSMPCTNSECEGDLRGFFDIGIDDELGGRRHHA